MPDAVPQFGPEALKFLRALKRNNRRDWFQPRKDDYERLVRTPMVAIVERLAGDMRAMAPEIVVDPKRAVFRIYRDTRFSSDKTPYKTHIAASFPWRGAARHQGAGLYFHVSPTEVWIGGGLYAPETAQLQAVREHLAANLRRWTTIVESGSFKRIVGTVEGEKLQRVPRGFPRDHEAAQWLRFRQFLAGRDVKPTLVTTSRFYPAIVETFRVVAPLIRFLNEPLVPRGR